MRETHNAKIVCTLGPSSDDRETIAELADAGMAVARLNASHGTPEDRAEIIERVKDVDASQDAPLATMLDLPGPEVRTAALDDPVRIEEGSEIDFLVGDEEVDLRPLLDPHWSIDRGSADLRSRQIQHGRQRGVLTGIYVLDPLDDCRAVLGRAMRGVEPGDCHAGVGQFGDRLPILGGRPQRTDDLRVVCFPHN